MRSPLASSVRSTKSANHLVDNAMIYTCIHDKARFLDSRLRWQIFEPLLMPYEEGRRIPEACMMMVQHCTTPQQTLALVNLWQLLLGRPKLASRYSLNHAKELIIIRIGKCLCKYAARRTRYFFLDSRCSRTYFISSRRWQVKQCCTYMRRRKPKIMVQKRRRDVEMG